jgi:quercetin dioxygenase-like cupin family protein
MENIKQAPITVGAKDGETISVVGDTYRVLLGGKNTNLAFAAIDMVIPPGGGPGPHSHSAIEESFYVIDGEVEVRSEFGVCIASKGSFVNIPKGGVIHSFKNKTDQIAHLLCVVIPAGLEVFFEEIGQPVAYGKFLPAPPMTPESGKQLQAIAEKYGQKVYPANRLETASMA